jgi:hypothetical protein
MKRVGNCLIRIIFVPSKFSGCMSYQNKEIINSVISIVVGIIIIGVAVFFSGKHYSDSSMVGEILNVAGILGSALIVIPIGGMIRSAWKKK